LLQESQCTQLTPVDGVPNTDLTDTGCSLSEDVCSTTVTNSMPAAATAADHHSDINTSIEQQANQLAAGNTCNNYN